MLKQRIITALILAPLVIASVFFLPINGFSLFLIAVLTIAGWEWANLAGYSGMQRHIYAAVIAILLFAVSYLPALWVLVPALLWWLVAFILVLSYPASARRWSSRWLLTLLGPVMLLPGYVGLLQLKLLPDSNFLIILLFFLIWGADIGAYFAGRRWGNAKLAPAVSPGKSWAGFYGGLATATIITISACAWLGKPALLSLEGLLFVLGCLFVTVVSVLGDLVESMFKRQRGIKDSSQLLPGHGGVLDRIDSLLAAGPLFALLILLAGWH
jgi:phosphatidate cytidylyltransferase